MTDLHQLEERLDTGPSVGEDKDGQSSTERSCSPTKRNSVVNMKSPHKKPTTKSVIYSVEENGRLMSQAQPTTHKRKSTIGKTKKGGTFSATQSRMVIINSPLMQPPPEIKQTKVIINLFSKCPFSRSNQFRCRRDGVSFDRKGCERGDELASDQERESAFRV